MKLPSKPLLQSLLLIVFTSLRVAGQEPRISPNPLEEAKTREKIVEISSQLRQIFLTLFEFEIDYGSFPDESTIADVTRLRGTIVRAASSDDCFGQIVAAGVVDDISLFSTEFSAPEPGGKPAKHTFSYISGLRTSKPPETPVVLVPLVRGKTIFDPLPLDGRAVVAFLDGSVRSFPIEANGTVLIDGKDLFDPAQPYWGGKAPTVKWPAR